MIPHSKPLISTHAYKAIHDVLKTNLITCGDKVRKFEESISSYIGTKKTFTTSNCTSAILMALKALCIKERDEVILPTYVCKTVLDAVSANGSIPVLCDIGNYWNVTTESVSNVLSSKTKAIIVVHIFGIPVNTFSFRKFNLPIIEDCAQAFGAITEETKVGSIGDIGVFSFQATKCLTTGEGGAITANNDYLIKKIENIANNNIVPSIMCDIQAALGLSQLDNYDQFILKRKNIAERYFKGLKGVVNLELPVHLKDKSIFFRYPVKMKKHNFSQIKIEYEKRNIQVRRGVDALLHNELGLSDSNFINSVKIFTETLSLPIYPALTEEEQAKVIEATRDIFC